MTSQTQTRRSFKIQTRGVGRRLQSSTIIIDRSMMMIYR